MANDYKVVLVGESGVGKSNIFQRFMYNRFDDGLRTTMGTDLERFQIDFGDGERCVQMWDTAGQERFHSMTSTMFLKNADGVMIVFDICQRSTFERVDYWRAKVDSCGVTRRNVTYSLVGNKQDLLDSREVTFSEAKKWAEWYGMMYHETSARTGENILPAVRSLAAEVHRRHNEMEDYWENEKNIRARLLLEQGPAEHDPHHHPCCSIL